MLRTKPDGKGGFDENSYRSGDDVNAFRWENLSKPDYQKTIEYYRGLIAFRKAHDSLRLKYRKEVVNAVEMISCRTSQVVVFKVTGTTEDILLIFNASTDAVTVNLPTGSWNVMIQDDIAGTDVLATKEGSVDVAPISATVLTQPKA